MITIEQAKDRIDCEVIYRPRGQSDREQIGIITKVNDAGLVFVRYGDDRYSKATYPVDLYWPGS
jgi:hypothetical protein